MKKYSAALLIIFAIATSFSLQSCNESDDVGEIFLGKQWKLTNIFYDENPPRLATDYWDNKEDEMKSIEQLNKKENFVISFDGFVEKNQIDGNYKGKGISADIEGRFKVDGESRVFNTNQQTVTSGDPLEKAFINGLSIADKYGGDSNSLQLFFTEKGKRRYLLFRVNEQ